MDDETREAYADSIIQLATAMKNGASPLRSLLAMRSLVGDAMREIGGAAEKLADIDSDDSVLESLSRMADRDFREGVAQKPPLPTVIRDAFWKVVGTNPNEATCQALINEIVVRLGYAPVYPMR